MAEDSGQVKSSGAVADAKIFFQCERKYNRNFSVSINVIWQKRKKKEKIILHQSKL